MGGTGKTPTVQMIAKMLIANGNRPVIVSRGYGGTSKDPVNIVSDGEALMLTATEAGDEPFMLASSVKGLPVLTGKKRSLPCQYACDKMQIDTIVLDDGFQHLGVKRDLDIVLFNATTLAGNSRVFPGGELREPVSALNRADAFLLTGITDENRNRAEAFSQLLEKRFDNTPVFLLPNKVSGIVNVHGEPVRREDLNIPLFAFSGIAHPERFLHQLKDSAFNIVGNVNFKDHATYNIKTQQEIINTALKHKAKGLITTQKDSVKLGKLPDKLPLYSLAIEADPPEGLVEFILSKLSTIRISEHEPVD